MVKTEFQFNKPEEKLKMRAARSVSEMGLVQQLFYLKYKQHDSSFCEQSKLA